MAHCDPSHPPVAHVAPRRSGPRAFIAWHLVGWLFVIDGQDRPASAVARIGSWPDSYLFPGEHMM